jgi:hypothetical protein
MPAKPAFRFVCGYVTPTVLPFDFAALQFLPMCVGLMEAQRVKPVVVSQEDAHAIVAAYRSLPSMVFRLIV